MARKKNLFLSALTRYCDNTSLHGFGYWTNSESSSLPARVGWVVLTLVSITGAACILSNTIKDWIDSPSVVGIETFSFPVTDLHHPAITVCKSDRFDAGEYVRAVYDNFEYRCKGSRGSSSCGKRKLLQEHFPFLIMPDAPTYTQNKTHWGREFTQGYLKPWADNVMRDTDLNTHPKFKTFRANRGKLVPYYFGSGGFNDSLTDTLLGLATDWLDGIDNAEEWDGKMGLKFRTELREGKYKRNMIHVQFYPTRYCMRGKVFPTGSRYNLLCKALFSDSFLPSAWRDFAQCFADRRDRYIGLKKWDTNRTLDTFQKCVYYEQPTAVDDLTEYDTFALAKALESEGKSILSDPDMFNKVFHDNQEELVTEYCTNTGKCDVAVVTEELSRTYLILTFLFRTKLPENSFGRLLANHPVNRQSEYLSTMINDYSAVFTCDAYLTLMKAIFKSSSNITKDSMIQRRPRPFGIARSHPIYLSESFRKDPTTAMSPIPAGLNYTFDDLARLLMFGSYIREQVASGSANISTVIKQELEAFPYTKKSKLFEPYLSPTDLADHQDSFRLAVTDRGLCEVYNGEAMPTSFKASKRMNNLRRLFNSQEEANFTHIVGTGPVDAQTFWLNLEDRKERRSLSSHFVAIPRRNGYAHFAINDWLSYFQVRASPITVYAGQEVIIKVEPVRHVATEAFKSLSVGHRRCLLPHEARETTTMFKRYSQEACLFECKLKYALNKTGCIPWDYPLPIHAENDTEWEASICTSVAPDGKNRLATFEAAMDSHKAREGCSACLPDCEDTQFKVQVNTMALDAEKLCSVHSNPKAVERAMNDWYRTKSPASHWYYQMSNVNYRDLFNNYRISVREFNPPVDYSRFGLAKSDMFDLCKDRYRNDLAKVTVMISEPEVMEIKKNIKVSFSDQLGVVGGTLGLFTGASLISLAEFVYWLQKIVVASLKSIMSK